MIHCLSCFRPFQWFVYDSLRRVYSTVADFLFRLTADENGQGWFAQMAWINKRPATSITAQLAISTRPTPE
jgi:hypothetical protein